MSVAPAPAPNTCSPNIMLMFASIHPATVTLPIFGS